MSALLIYDSKEWKKIEVRDSTKGKIRVYGMRKRVWLWDNEESKAKCWWVVCVKELNNNKVKWFLSNADENITLCALVRKHHVRFWIERMFQDAKTSVGMADYQVRKWRAWHHHMTMVMLALLFMLEEKMGHNQRIELLSCQDIVELLTWYLPRTSQSEEDVLNNIKIRQRKRKKAIDQAYERQRLLDTNDGSILTK